MTRDELTRWLLTNGWQIVAGYPSLTKPSAPTEAVVRLVMKATMMHVEVKKPAGKWEKFAGERYGRIAPHADTGLPTGLGFEKTPGFLFLMGENRDRQVFAGFSR